MDPDRALFRENSERGAVTLTTARTPVIGWMHENAAS